MKSISLNFDKDRCSTESDWGAIRKLDRVLVKRNGLEHLRIRGALDQSSFKRSDLTGSGFRSRVRDEHNNIRTEPSPPKISTVSMENMAIYEDDLILWTEAH
jgi:hypothetical protein